MAEQAERKPTKKERTHQRILESAATLFKREGFDRAGVDSIMEAAGLTHGGFYAHFKNKDALAAETAAAALRATREQWFAGLEDLTPAQRIQSLLARYLNTGHRDGIDIGCALPALIGDFARADADLRDTVQAELTALLDSVQAALEDDSDRGRELAGGLLACCIGGMALARAAPDSAESERFLRGARLVGLRALKQVERERKENR